MGDTTSMIGTSSSNVNPIFEELLKNLTQYANAPLLIRDLADEQNVADYTQGNLGAIAQVGQDLGAQFFIGVDFGDDDLTTATGQAQQLTRALPGSELQAIELGNEPDLYGNSGEREAGWDYTEYLSEYQQFAPALITASGGVKLRLRCGRG